jgi:hypothetical protein
MTAPVGSNTATHRAYAMIQNTLDQQATIYAYVDDLRYMALLCVLCAPIIFIVKKVKAKKGAAPAGH